MWEAVAGIGIPLLKFVFERIAGRKLNDQEFQRFVRAFNDEKKRAGKVAKDWRQKLEEKLREIEESESQDPPAS